MAAFSKQIVYRRVLTRYALNPAPFLNFAKRASLYRLSLCKYLRSSLKTVRRTVFPPVGVALSSNLSLTASQVKQKEQAKACSFCLAGVERFELPDDGVRVRSLTAWRYPTMELNRNVKRSLLRAPPLFSPYIIHAYSLFCKCFNAFSRKSSIFFAPSLKLKYNAVVSYRASWRLTSQSNSSAVLRVTS